MITFYQYLQQYHEIITLDNTEILSNMEILMNQTNKKGYKITLDGARFVAYLLQENIPSYFAQQGIISEYLKSLLPPFFYEIYFSNRSPYPSSNGMVLQNLYGAKATKFYNFLIIAIKKSIEDFERDGKPVNIIKYFGISPETDAIYERFFNDYLKEKYVRINDKYLMKKEIFEELTKSNPNLTKIQTDAEEDHKKYIQQIMDLRKEARKQRISLSKL